jgi:hypothetical protein
MAQKLERSPCMVPSNVGTRPLNSRTRIVLDYYSSESLIDFNPFLKTAFTYRDGEFQDHQWMEYPARHEEQQDFFRYYFTLSEFFQAFSPYCLTEGIGEIADFFELNLADRLGESELEKFGESELLLDQIRNLDNIRQARLTHDPYRSYLIEHRNISKEELEGAIRSLPRRLSDKTRLGSGRTVIRSDRLEEIDKTFLSLPTPILIKSCRIPQLDLTNPFEFLRHYRDVPTDNLKITRV